MLCVKINGNETKDKNAATAIAATANTIPTKKPITANKTFITIKNTKPSRSQVNIIPGNLIDEVNMVTKTSRM